jgi:hypothetical protein
MALQAQNSIGKSKLFWVFPCLIILMTGAFAFSELSEFYTVAINGETEGYPWGAVNEVPWYYQTPTTYSIYALTSGLLFLAATILIALALIKKSRKLMIIGVSLAFMLFLVDVVSTNKQ